MSPPFPPKNLCKFNSLPAGQARRTAGSWFSLAAFVCLLVVAGGLRFHDLSEKSLRHDEAVAANISRGALSEVIAGTRSGNSSPILYPLALWAVQKVDVSAFSIRVLPATASVLTVAVLLFLLPRSGLLGEPPFWQPCSPHFPLKQSGTPRMYGNTPLMRCWRR